MELKQQTLFLMPIANDQTFAKLDHSSVQWISASLCAQYAVGATGIANELIGNHLTWPCARCIFSV